MHTTAGAVERFLTHLQAGGASPGTLKLRATQLRRLAAAAPDLGDVTPELLEAVLATPGWKPETRKSYRAAVSTFCAWSTRRGLLAADPAADLPPVSVPDAEPRPAPMDVVRATFAAADATGDPRDPVMVRLALLCGLRVKEIAAVHSDDVEGEELRVHGKGGRSRLVDLPPVLRLAIANRRGWVFPGRYGGPITAGWVTKRLSRLMPPGWTAHTLRHAAGTAVHEAGGGDILVTMRFLGHSKPETTRRYVRTSPDKVRAAQRAAARRWADAG